MRAAAERRASPRRPTWPTTWCAAAHHFATRTKRSRAPCATPKPRASTWPRCPVAELRQFSPLVGDDVHGVLTLEGSVASRDHPGGTAPAQVRAAVAAARKTLPPAHEMLIFWQGHAAKDRTMKLRIPGPRRHGVSRWRATWPAPDTTSPCTTAPRRRPRNGSRRTAAQRGDAGGCGSGARDRDDVRRQRRRRARGRHRAPTARCRAWRAGTILVDHTTASAEVAREVFAAAQAQRGRLSRCARVRRPGRRGERQAHDHGRRRARGVRARGERARDLRARGHADGRPRQRPAHEDGQPDLHRGPRRGAVGRHPFRDARRARSRRACST